MDIGTFGPAVAGGAAFVGVFGVFVAALVVLAVVTLRWAVRRDRAGRAAWVKRRSAEEQGAPTTAAQTNGHGKRPAQPDERRKRPAQPDERPARPAQPGKSPPREHRGPGARG